MIVSFPRQFIFIKTSKTAGTSLEIALSKYAAAEDILTPISAEDEVTRRKLGYPGPQNYLAPPGLLQKLRLKEPEMKFFNHMRAAQIRETLGRELFDRYLKVAVVRNPYDMVVSRYFWSHRKDPKASPAQFREWLSSRPKGLLKNRKITHIDGKSAVDFVIRFENFREDIPAFARKVGLPETLFDEFNATRAKSHYRPKLATTRDMFSGFDVGRAVVAEMFAEEIERFGYACP